MKRVILIDFGLQSVVFVLAIFLLLWQYVRLEDPSVSILGIQFVLGGWQLSSASVNLISGTRYRKQRIIHLAAAIILLIMLYIAWDANILLRIRLWALIVPSWILGIFYYWITCITAFPRGSGKQSGFLPHTSF